VSPPNDETFYPRPHPTLPHRGGASPGSFEGSPLGAVALAAVRRTAAARAALQFADRLRLGGGRRTNGGAGAVPGHGIIGRGRTLGVVRPVALRLALAVRLAAGLGLDAFTARVAAAAAAAALGLGPAFTLGQGRL